MIRYNLLIICLLYSATINGQWNPTSGPHAAIVTAITAKGVEIFAGTPRGIFKSIDSGASWVEVNTGLSNRSVLSLAVNGNNLFAGTDGGGVFVSNNSGSSWASISGFSFAIVNAIASDGNFMYAATTNGIRVSNDSGATWAFSNNGLTNTNIQALAVYNSTIIAGTSGGIFLSSNNGSSWNISNTGLTSTYVKALIVVGQNIYCGTLFGTSVSTNGGASWNSAFTAANGAINTLASDGSSLFVSSSNGLYSCQFNGSCTPIDIYPGMCGVISMSVIGNELFAGTSGFGIHKTNNNGISWNSVNQGIRSGINYSICFVGDTLFTGEVCGIIASPDSGSSWMPVVNGLSGAGCYDLASNGNEIYAALYGSGMYYSNNFGTTWNNISSGLITSGSQFIWDIKIIGNDIFIATQDGVYHSSNNGTSWTQLNNGFNNLWVWSIENIGSNLFAATNDGVYKSTNNGNSWIPANVGLPSNISRSHLAVIGSNLYVGYYSDGVYLSTDNGDSWVQVNNGLTNTNIKTLFSHGVDLFAGTNYSGIYHSNNNGASWNNISNGLSHYNIQSFGVYGNTIFVGTYDGPIYKNDNIITGYPESLADSFEIDIYPNPFSDYLNLNSDYYKLNEIVKIEIYNIHGTSLMSFSQSYKFPMTINLAHLSNGMYNVKVVTKSTNKNFVVAKVN